MIYMTTFTICFYMQYAFKDGLKDTIIIFHNFENKNVFNIYIYSFVTKLHMNLNECKMNFRVYGKKCIWQK